MNQLPIRYRLLLLVALPLVGLAYPAYEKATEATSTVASTRQVQQLVVLSTKIGDLVHELQKERGASAGYLGSKGMAFRDKLDQQRALTGARLDTFQQATARLYLSAGPAARLVESLEAAQADLARLDAHRQKVDALGLVATESNAYYSRLNATLLDAIVHAGGLSDDAAVARHLQAYTAFMLAKERAGIERALLSATFSQDAFTPALYASFVAMGAQQTAYMHDFAMHATAEQIAFRDATLQGPAADEVERLRGIAQQKAATGGFGVSGPAWFDAATRRIDLMKQVESRLSDDVLQLAAGRERAAQSVLRTTGGAALVLLVLAGLACLLVIRSITRPLRRLETTIAHIADSGDLAQRTGIAGRDEVGRAALAFDRLIGAMHQAIEEVTLTVMAVAQGDFSRQVTAPLPGDLDTLKRGVNASAGAISTTSAGLAAVMHALREGHLSERMSPQVKKAYRDMVDGAMASLQAVVADVGAVMQAVAAGDLTRVVTAEARGELAALKSSVNDSVGQMRGMIARVSQAVADTATASAEIRATTDHIAGGVQHLSAQTREVAAAVEEMSRTACDSARNAAASADVAVLSGQKAEGGGEIVRRTAAMITRLAQTVRDSTQTVEHLGASGEQIGQIVQTIDEIASQTNLLALNATIEAARAGEHGRSFAVVADEVRKLAERTRTATTQVAERIAQVRHQTTEAVEAMHLGSREVAEGHLMAAQAGEALGQIVAGTAETITRITRIATASHEQSLTSEQVARSVETISQVTADSSAGIVQIARATEALNRLTEELMLLVSGFTLGADRAPARARQRARGMLEAAGESVC